MDILRPIEFGGAYWYCAVSACAEVIKALKGMIMRFEVRKGWKIIRIITEDPIRVCGEYTLIPRMTLHTPAWTEVLSKYYDIPGSIAKMSEYTAAKYIHPEPATEIIVRSDGSMHIPDKLKVAWCTKRWSGQNALLAHIATHYRTCDGLTLELNTGKGKTLLFSYLIYKHLKRGRRSVIFAQNTELQSQIVDELMVHISGLARENIVCVGGTANTRDVGAAEYGINTAKVGQGKLVWVIIINSAPKFGPTFWNNFYFSVFDECHRYCHDTGMPILRQCQTPKKLALSATPQPKWNSPYILHWCGPLFDGNAIIPDRRAAGQVHVIRYSGGDQYTITQKSSIGDLSVPLMVQLISQDPVRVALAISLICEARDGGHTTLVMAWNNECLDQLRQMYQDKGRPDKLGTLISGVKRAESVRIRQECGVIFTNYQYSSVGLNIPRATAIIYYHPYKNDGKQINGRILRSNSDVVRQYYDIVDTKTFLARQFSTRLHDYNEREFEIVARDHPGL